MTIIILIAALAQVPEFDLGTSVPEFDLSGSGQIPEFTLSGVGSVPTILQPTKLSEPTRGPLAFGYTKPRCPGCDTLKVEKERLNSPHIELKDPPAWTAGHAFPVMHWETPKGWQSMDGWPGAGKFLTLYDESMKAKAAQAAPQVVQQQLRVTPSYGNHWTHPDTIFRHLIQEHGYSPAQLRGLSEEQMLTLHDQAHESAPQYRAAQQRSRGLFSRMFGGRG